VAETTTAATYETAELYRTLAQDLLKSERPKKMSSDEIEQYNSLLDEQAFPFEEQSISIHELNAKRAQDGVYDESVRKSFTALAELKPARYGKTELSAGMTAAAAQPGPPPSAAMQAELQSAIDLGLLARQQGKLTDSEAALRHATQVDAGSAVAWDELGITLRSEGKFADAREAYQHAITDNDSYAAAHRNMGVLLDLYIGDPAAAIPEFERYKALTSEDKPVSTWIAELRARTGIKAPAPAQPPAGDTPADAAPGAFTPAPSTAASTNHGGST
jgi:tetratricopeptide (TPR) repeat protein